MARLSRLTELLILLQSRRVVTAREAAERFGVSERTVYRDIRTLVESGVPVRGEAGTGYTLARDWHLPPVVFTEAEAFALLTAGHLARLHGDAAFIRDADAALTKIRAGMKGPLKDRLDALDRRLFRPDAPADRTRFLYPLQQALVAADVVRLRYTDADGGTTEREVEPHGIWFTARVWLVVAWCRLRSDWREFRLDRIASAERTGERFAPRPDFELGAYLQRVRPPFPEGS